MVNIYVLNKDGMPMMPIHSYGRAKKMVKSGKARIVRTKPFTLQLTKQKENAVVDPVLLGLDPGRTNIGICCIDSKGHVLFASDVTTRNKVIAKYLLERKRQRQASRRGERKVRQRRAIASDKTGMARATEFWRMLPGCKKPLCCKVIRNTPSKFEHRRRKEGWLTPTANHLLQTHLNAVKLVMEFLPVSIIVAEINRFDFARMENPGIRNWEYQMGKLAGYSSVDEAVYIQQKGKCLLCGRRKIDHYHHIVPVTQGGSESIDNKAGLCWECHEGPNGVHKNNGARKRLEKKKQGLRKKYHALSVINQIMARLLTELNKIRPLLVTTGYETQAIRKACPAIPKKQKDDGTHYMDAWCIAVSALENGVDTVPDFQDSYYDIRQFRRHDRARVKAQTERTYYLDGEAVAHNRHKRTGQSDTKDNWDSLAEFRAKNPKAVSQLTVKKSKRSYNNMKRNLPGALVLYEGKRHVVTGNHNGRYTLYGVKGNGISRSKCQILKKNTGLVFM